MNAPNDYALTEEQAEALRARGDRWLSSYYIDFDSTGNEAVDLILAAVARAAKLYHSTEWWNDEDYAVDGATPAELIQRAANSAAAHIDGSGT